MVRNRTSHLQYIVNRHGVSPPIDLLNPAGANEMNCQFLLFISYTIFYCIHGEKMTIIPLVSKSQKN